MSFLPVASEVTGNVVTGCWLHFTGIGPVPINTGAIIHQ